ncbi:uncharacterized protein LOC105801146 [Gossypium raimondii]|uniref:uncharacterized protein LOC105801146 n=1 Tax=Gossypium raimondii TaxID=29730 RepID=UPI00063A933B|nr:uncharacterized protein LOC105801146 [Gossypium raimondii]
MNNPAQQPPPPIIPAVVPPIAPLPLLVIEPSRRIPIEKLRKCGTEEFKGKLEDDPVKAEYCLQNILRVFNKMASPLDDFIRCVVSLLKEEAYSWWTMIVAVVPREKISWDFFQSKFKNKNVGKRYLDKKKREFLKLQQGNKSVVEYEREFVYLSKYAREIVPTEEEMFNSVGSVRNVPKPNYRYCGKYHPGECRAKSEVCFRCGSTDHFIQNCPKPPKEDEDHKGKKMSTSQKGRCLGQNNVVGMAHTGVKDTVVLSEARAPAHTCAIRAREEAATPDVIASIFYLFDVIVYAFINHGSTHSYICTALVTKKKLPVESTNYDIQVTNRLGQSEIVNLVCRKCPLKVKGCEFLVDLMLLHFQEFDVSGYGLATVA